LETRHRRIWSKAIFVDAWQGPYAALTDFPNELRPVKQLVRQGAT